jgi:hypothetical protein
MNPAEDTTRSQKPREICRGIRERDALLANPNRQIRQIRFCDRDFGVRTERQFRRMLDEYRLVWRPLELSTGARWRHDEDIFTTAGTVMKLNARNMWWSRRKPVFHLFDKFVTDGRDEIAAVERIVQIYQSTPRSPTSGNITLDTIRPHFRSKLAEIVPHRHGRGRPSAEYLQRLRGNGLPEQPNVAVAMVYQPNMAMVQQPHLVQTTVQQPNVPRVTAAARQPNVPNVTMAQQLNVLNEATAQQLNVTRTTAQLE